MTTVNYATPFERLIARIIDKFVITLPVFIWFGGQSNLMVEAIGGGILLVAIVVLNVLWDGQTVGKRVMKIRIQSNGTTKLTAAHYLVRELFFTVYPVYLLANTLVQTAWLFWMLTTMVLILMYGRGLHDYIARTQVVKVNAVVVEDDTKEDNSPQ
ncbi:RDD family protein [Desulforamulus ferrireducens]|uniref:Transporter n=1 Tax=Desulforamulus ferrireducens TaxID=1833852 RepID=A0A1S6ITT4_9FIRM|nr:RDD family protein [Desulforamulus ferrireducens]AQS58181.1 transporter [Desulforamulus ferrireducens]